MNTLDKFYAAIRKEQVKTEPADLVWFGNMGFERKALRREPETVTKVHIYQDAAEASLLPKGLHLPRLRDVFDKVIIPGIEGKLRGEQEKVFNDIISGSGEWGRDLELVKGSTLYLAEGIVGWKGDEYDNGKVIATRVNTYNIAGLPLVKMMSLKDVAKVNPRIPSAFYSKQLTKLPTEIQQKAYLWLPPEGVVRPVSRGDIGYDATPNYKVRAVRGVAQKNLHEK